jgi:hypothetical protein
MRIAVYCATCLEKVALPPPTESREGSVTCSKGHEPIAYRHSDSVAAGARVDRCSRCETTAVFSQKDFDQRVGCALLAVGAAAALGISRLVGGIWFVPVLLAFAALDFVLARRVGSVVICYRCDSEYRDVPGASSYRPYDPHVAERYAEVKTVRRLNA